MDQPPPATDGACESAANPGSGGLHCSALAAVAADPDMQALAELVQLGTELARAVHQQIMDAPRVTPDGPPMFDRLALTVRRTIALRLKLNEALLARFHREAARQAGQRALRQRTRAERKQQVRTEVEKVIAVQAAPSVAQQLRADLHERLNDADRDENFDRMSVGELVRAICKDLGVTTDMPNYPHRLAARTDLIGDIGKEPPPPADPPPNPPADPPPDPPADPLPVGTANPPAPGHHPAGPPGPAARGATGPDPPDTG
jgi:hypothetical protein